jgi:threonine dehydrogenase-like Zn-dependent dehydrogenase
VRVPTPGAGQILVKIAAAGVCHTDLHAAEGDWPVKPSPPSSRVTKASDTWWHWVRASRT